MCFTEPVFMRDIPETHRESVPSTRRVIPSRVALVAFSLIPAGAVAGGLAGALGATILTAAEGVLATAVPFVLGVAGVLGAVLGAVILPVAGFTLLRYVPLGRALAETIVATALGGAIGVPLLGAWWLAGPLAGFGVAATRLWALARRTRARQYAAVELEP
jgi:hypothetical protein